MRDVICGAVLEWYRECPIKPGGGRAEGKAVEKYLIYESRGQKPPDGSDQDQG